MAASARIDELRSKFDDNPRRYFASLANEYRKAGDLGTAIAICRAQLRQFPSHMSGHVVLGQALYESGELDAARTAFERAVELDPENLIALRHLGDAAMAQRDRESARRWYRRVLDIDPTNDTIAGLVASLDGPPVEEIRARYVEVFATPPASTPAAAAPADEAPAPERAPEPEPSALVDDVPATGDGTAVLLDLAPDDLAWPAPVAPDADLGGHGEPAVIEAMEPASASVVDQAAAESAAAEPSADEGAFEFVDGWGALDLPDQASVDDGPAIGVDVPPVGLDLTPADDAAARDLAHADVGALDLPTVEASGADEAQAPTAEPSPTDEPTPVDEPTPAGDDRSVAETLEYEAPAAVQADPIRVPYGETAPLDDVMASDAFVTETMAQLCLEQGHDEEALAIYERLVAQRPDDRRLVERRDALRMRLSAPADGETAGAFLRRIAELRPTPASTLAVAPTIPEPTERDTWAASAWRDAFRADAAPDEPLFAAIGVTSEPPAEPTPPQEFSFERFFVGLEEELPAHVVAPEPEAPPPAVAPEPPAAAPEPESEEDLAEFNAWLRGLREP